MPKKNRYILVSSPLFADDARAFIHHFADLFRAVVVPAGTLIRYDQKREPVYIVARPATRADIPGMDGEAFLEPEDVLKTVPVGRRIWRRDRVG